MRNFILRATEGLLWRGQLSIRQRIFRMLLVGSLLTFLVLCALDFVAMTVIRRDLDHRAEDFARSTASHLEGLSTDQAKERLKNVCETQAQYVERELGNISENVNFLAESMEQILRHPQNYRPQTLPVDYLEQIKSGQAYLHIPQDIRNGNMDENIWREIGLAANIAETLCLMGDKYTDYASSVQICSRHGYMIAVEESGYGDNEIIRRTTDFMTDVDPRLRPWYSAAIEATEPVLTDPYLGSGSYYEFTCALPYYDENGFAGVVGISTGLYSLSQTVEQTAVGEDGFSFVLNNDGQVVLSARQTGIFSVTGEHHMTDDLRTSDNETIAKAAELMVNGGSGLVTVKVAGEEYYVAFAPMKTLHWSFATVMKKDNITVSSQAVGHSILQQMLGLKNAVEDIFGRLMYMLLGALAVLALGVFIVSRYMSRRFVRPIYALADGVREISGGNLSHKLDIRTGDELEHLAVCFNAMTDEVARYLEQIARTTAEKERIATELAVAADIQGSMLPSTFPAFPERSDFDIYASMQAAKEVGGDFYDFYLMDKNHLLIAIADVSGKGVAASLFMVITKTVMANFAQSLHNVGDLAGLIGCTNRQISQNNEAMMFVTAFVGVLDTVDGRFVYVNAGHNPPLLYSRAKHHFAYLRPQKNCPLGVKEGFKYVQEEITLNKGDCLYLYTDGVTEALNEENEMFGEGRLLKSLNAAAADKIELKQLLTAVKSDLAQHVGSAEQSDDITTLALSR